MLAFYDLALSPVSFDVGQFLVCAKAYANSCDEDLHVVIVPGTTPAGFRPKDPKPIDDIERRWRVDHIVIPCIKAIGGTHTVAPSRAFASALVPKQSHRFPMGYTVEQPIPQYTTRWPVTLARQGFPLPSFEPSEEAKRKIAQWLDGRTNVVTIGIRETFTPTRNSKKHQWFLFGDWLERNGFCPVVIPDTATVHAPETGGMPCCDMAAIDVDLRLALYDSAIMNCSVNNGPMVLNVWSKRPWMVVRMTSEPMIDETGRKHWAPTASYMEKQGIPEGTQYPQSHERQRQFWIDDTAENITRSFCEVMNVDNNL